MSVIVHKQKVLHDDNKEINNVQLEKEIYQQMNLIQLEDLNVVSLEEIKNKLSSIKNWQ